MVKARKYVVKTRFEGIPKKSEFEIVEYELPSLENDEFLVKTEWISIEPYLSVCNKNIPLPYDQFGYQVGIVEESKNPDYPVGTRVVTHNGWCDYSIVNVAKVTATNITGLSLEMLYKVPDLGCFSPSHAIGAAGMPGITAYFGMLNICQPKSGETVVVTGAAGAVGTVAGQIAKIKGCKVIGFAGSDEKVKWLEEEVGFDKAFNYKTVDVHTVLKTAAPKGIDCYFDNVGGEISSIIINQMNKFGRVAVCGCISTYYEDPTKTITAPILQPAIVIQELKIEGYIVTRWLDRWQEAISQLTTWIKSGQLKPMEHVTVGFDKLHDALVGMFAGENKGKAVVKI